MQLSLLPTTYQQGATHTDMQAHTPTYTHGQGWHTNTTHQEGILNHAVLGEEPSQVLTRCAPGQVACVVVSSVFVLSVCVCRLHLVSSSVGVWKGQGRAHASV